MSSLRDRLRSLAERLAMPMQRASSSMALCVSDSRDNLTLVLLDPSHGRLLRQMILGYAALCYERRSQVWVLDMVAAEKGYGPYMYQLAMSYIADSLNQPDLVPSDNNSEAARKVWLECYRSEDYEHHQFHDPHSDDPTDIALAQEYRIVKPLRYEHLMDNFLDLAKQKRKTEDKLIAEVEKLALDFFSIKYHGKPLKPKTKVAMPMKTVPELETERVALFIEKNPEATWFFLVDCVGFERENGKPPTAKSLHKLGNLDEKDYFRGYVQVEAFAGHSIRSLWEVTSSEAIKGYGPLLYQIAMSYLRKTIPKSWLVGNITGDISSPARRVWSRIFSDPKFDKKKLEPIIVDTYHQIIDDEEFLKYRYRIKQPINYEKIWVQK